MCNYSVIVLLGLNLSACNFFIRDSFIETKSLRCSMSFISTVFAHPEMSHKARSSATVCTHCVCVCVRPSSRSLLRLPTFPAFPAWPSKCSLQLPVLKKELFHFNDVFFCTFVWKACGSESASCCLFCGMGVAVAELDSLRCPCIQQEAGGSRTGAEHTRHAAPLCLTCVYCVWERGCISVLSPCVGRVLVSLQAGHTVATQCVWLLQTATLFMIQVRLLQLTVRWP